MAANQEQEVIQEGLSIAGEASGVARGVQLRVQSRPPESRVLPPDSVPRAEFVERAHGAADAIVALNGDVPRRYLAVNKTS